MRNHFIYFLIFKNNTHFKIGKSKSLFRRIQQHNLQYKIDFQGSYFFKLKDEFEMNISEKLIKNKLKGKQNHNYRADGHTEIFEIKYLNEALSVMTDINYFSIEKLSYCDLKPLKKKIIVKKIKKKKIEKSECFHREFNQKNMEELFNNIEEIITQSIILRLDL